MEICKKHATKALHACMKHVPIFIHNLEEEVYQKKKKKLEVEVRENLSSVL